MIHYSRQDVFVIPEFLTSYQNSCFLVSCFKISNVINHSHNTRLVKPRNNNSIHESSLGINRPQKNRQNHTFLNSQKPIKAQLRNTRRKYVQIHLFWILGLYSYFCPYSNASSVVLFLGWDKLRIRFVGYFRLYSITDWDISIQILPDLHSWFVVLPNILIGVVCVSRVNKITNWLTNHIYQYSRSTQTKYILVCYCLEGILITSSKLSSPLSPIESMESTERCCIHKTV